jgi:hypothetical protein
VAADTLLPCNYSAFVLKPDWAAKAARERNVFSFFGFAKKNEKTPSNSLLRPLGRQF